MSKHRTMTGPGFPTQCTFCALTQENAHPPADGYFKQSGDPRLKIGICKKHAQIVGYGKVTWYGAPEDCDGKVIEEGDMVNRLHTSNGVTIIGKRVFLVNEVLKRHRAQCRLSNNKTAFCDRLQLIKGES